MVDSFGSRKPIPKKVDSEIIWMRKRWVFLLLFLERGSRVPVLVENLALVHAHEPVESHDQH